jgi:hypothetical protein
MLDHLPLVRFGEDVVFVKHMQDLITKACLQLMRFRALWLIRKSIPSAFASILPMSPCVMFEGWRGVLHATLVNGMIRPSASPFVSSSSCTPPKGTTLHLQTLAWPNSHSSLYKIWKKKSKWKRYLQSLTFPIHLQGFYLTGTTKILIKKKKKACKETERKSTHHAILNLFTRTASSGTGRHLRSLHSLVGLILPHSCRTFYTLT